MSQPAETMRLKPQRGPQTSFLASDADIVFYGGAAGAGKSFGLLLWPLRWVNNPRFGSVIFRRTFPEIEAEGGLWDESCGLYPLVGGVGRKHDMTWTFPSGAVISFAHMQTDDDRFKWKSAQIPAIGFDQIETFTADQFFYMLSRNRTSSGLPTQIRATCNPDPDSFVASLISWYIDQETGYPIRERAGVRRYFVRDGDELVWGNSVRELILRKGADPDTRPTSFQFIPATIKDNPILLNVDKTYLSRLRSMSLIDREQLEKGNWKIRAGAGIMFRKEWFEFVDAAPESVEIVRHWDLGGTEDGDPSAGVKLGFDRATSTYYIMDAVSIQDVPHVVESAILNTASQDGRRVTVGLSRDPGQAGVWQISHLVSALDGYNVATSQESGRGDKVERAKPTSAQCGHGKVKVVRGAWNNDFINQLVNFPSKGWHDDYVDALVNAHFTLRTSGTKSKEPPKPSVLGRVWSQRRDRTLVG